jgi:hypothetical protein
MKIAIFVEQAGHFAGGSDRAPAVIDTLAGQREMQAEIHFRMRFGVVGNFREPRAGHHDAGGIDYAGFKSLDRGGVDGVRDAKIVGMNDQKLGVRRITEPFGESSSCGLRDGGTSCGDE